METSNSTRSTTVADTLLDAALYIDAYGWCQGNLTEHVPGTLPRACALGAIHAVTNTVPRRPFTGQVQQAVCYLADFLDDGIYRGPYETPAEVVWNFNDHPDTTQHLVTHALRTAAKRARAELGDQAVAS